MTAAPTPLSSKERPLSQKSLLGFRSSALGMWLCIGASLTPLAAAAQNPMQDETQTAIQTTRRPLEAGIALPDDPSASLALGFSLPAADPSAEPAAELPAKTRREIRQEQIASLHEKYIPAGYRVLPLPPHDKVLLGLQDLYAPHTFISIAVSAGYSDLRNGPPNYGSDRTAFAKRVGAAALRDTSGDILTDGVFAPLLHEDPRYYIVGPGHDVVRRALYAITRPLITRTDRGRPTINGALLLGNATASVLTNAYYPAINRNATDTVETFAGSLGGAATGFVITEFTGDLLRALHLQHPQ